MNCNLRGGNPKQRGRAHANCSPRDRTPSGGVTRVHANWERLVVLEAQRAEMCPDLEAGLGALWRGAQPRTLQFIAARTETETVWPGELTEEQTEVSLL